MERFTEWNSDHSHAGGLPGKDCYTQLARYEDTGLTPEEVEDLLSTSELSPEAQYAINQHADSLIQRLDALLNKSDREPPILVGDTVWVIDHDNIVTECKVSMIQQKSNKSWKFRVSHPRWGVYDCPATDLGKSAFRSKQDAKRELERKKSE